MSDLNLDGLRELGEVLRKAFDENDKALAEIADKCDNETKLAVTAWVFKNIVEHAQEGGSYRTLIYDRLGFGPEAYAPLYSAGGMIISNEFDTSQMNEIKKVVKENKIEAMKEVLVLCDEPGCFDETSCGWPTEDGGYRRTCGTHYHGRLKNGSVASTE